MLTLRPLRGDDVPGLEMLTAADVEWKRRLGMPHATWWRLVSTDADRFGWLVISDEEVIGYVDAERDGGTVSMAMAVFESWRGRGHSRKIIELLTTVEPLCSARALIATVEPDNRASRAVARSAGFFEDGRDKDGLVIYRMQL
ncbi:GNAT family N-acetyltransferase [Pseudonocardia xishanensis]|uniref:N-acetyltransferase domain-containing protein n=1 Tax=Pseudonocardia xishanensis TaxID=630995 RepID=A0ABP8RLE8_9PSEU